MNALNRLGNVLNKSSRYIAKVVSVNSNGTTIVLHNDGSKEVVLGDTVASGNVYIKDGVIINKAADLPYTEISI